MIAGLLASSALAQEARPVVVNPASTAHAGLHAGRNNFSLPVVDYLAPNGTWKRSHGILVGRDVTPNAMVGLGFFSIRPKGQQVTPNIETAPKNSKKVALGFSLRF